MYQTNKGPEILHVLFINGVIFLIKKENKKGKLVVTKKEKEKDKKDEKGEEK